MFCYDFSDHQNRYIRLQDMPAGYLDHIRQTTQEDPFYPLWHIAPLCGLLNDPCGLFQKDGVHHIFHQWFPAGPVHGLKHWYLLTTRDFVHYEDKGPALCPELPFDSHGCYTGMALPTAEGADLYYTGIQGEEQTPCIAQASCTDGIIRDRRCILPWDPAASTRNFRDPCVFVQDGAYFMLVGAERPNHEGSLLLYRRAEDGAWLPVGPVDLGGYPFGYMLECPNYYETDGEGVLFFSPMGIQSRDKYEFRNVFSVVYAKGAPLDHTAPRFSCANFHEMDKGFDFYAPQTYRDEQGRQLLFGWLGNSKSAYPTDANHWAHTLTAPRQITWAGDRMVQTPLPELEALRTRPQPLGQGQPILLDTLSFELDALAQDNFFLELRNAQGDCVRFTAGNDEFCLDRSSMTHLYAETFGTRRWARRLLGRQRLRVLADRSSLEIFADDGQTVFTSRIFLDGTCYLTTIGLEGAFYRLAPIAIAHRGEALG